ncbi:hypothetical protein [Shewanella maritima]|uniref:hypothetical protein n=1 Tax=Shewanella maritima TaxID=2520507 RepID=UPI0037358857
MNNVVEYEAGVLVDLVASGDSTRINMFMDSMGMPYDVQDKLISELMALDSINQDQVAEILENNTMHSLSSHLTF